jgi:copper chaperone CopZ/mannose-6-phosphate isomerase-like protein (cupin superfamily)
MNEEMGMTEVKKISDWKSLVKYSPEGPQHHVLADTGSYRAVLVGIQAGGTIPQHPSTDATYHFLEGTGTMIVDDERFLVSAGTTMVVPAKAARGIEAETQLAFLGSHGGHGNHADHGKAAGQQHKDEAPKSRRPMLMFGLMTLSMLVVMLGLWQIGASPMAMMLSGFEGMGLGVWGTMLLPMLGLLGMFVMMFVMYRNMVGMRGGMMGHDHAAMMAQMERPQEEVTASQQITYTISAISCGGCKQTIETKVGALDGVASVQVDVKSQQVVIDYDTPATEAGLEAFLGEIGYPVTVS